MTIWPNHVSNWLYMIPKRTHQVLQILQAWVLAEGRVGCRPLLRCFSLGSLSPWVALCAPPPCPSSHLSPQVTLGFCLSPLSDPLVPLGLGSPLGAAQGESTHSLQDSKKRPPPRTVSKRLAFVIQPLRAFRRAWAYGAKGNFIFFLLECTLNPRWPQDGAKMAPRWPQDGPRRPQDAPKDPKTAQDEPQNFQKTITAASN